MKVIVEEQNLKKAKDKFKRVYGREYVITKTKKLNCSVMNIPPSQEKYVLESFGVWSGAWKPYVIYARKRKI